MFIFWFFVVVDVFVKRAEFGAKKSDSARVIIESDVDPRFTMQAFRGVNIADPDLL
jgi:hypothetical protein